MIIIIQGCTDVSNLHWLYLYNEQCNLNLDLISHLKHSKLYRSDVSVLGPYLRLLA